MEIAIIESNSEHFHYSQAICDLMAVAAQKRGTGIAKRTPDYLQSKMEEGKAVIALDGTNLVGFCYIETWGHGKYVANSGLIVNPDYQGLGIARKIKAKIFELSQKKFPTAKIFGITTSGAVMNINSSLGYKPVTFSELTDDEQFWKGCQSCKNYDILTRNNRKMCLCTGMLYDTAKENAKKEAAKAEAKTTKPTRLRRDKAINPKRRLAPIV